MATISNEDAIATLLEALFIFRKVNTASRRTVPLLETFLLVARGGRITVGDLAKAVGVSPSAMSKILDDLSHVDRRGDRGMGLIERERGLYQVSRVSPFGLGVITQMAAAGRGWQGRRREKTPPDGDQRAGPIRKSAPRISALPVIITLDS